MAEGKQLAVCIGLMKLSTQEMYDIVHRFNQAYFLIILSLSLSLALVLQSIKVLVLRVYTTLVMDYGE